MLASMTLLVGFIASQIGSLQEQRFAEHERRLAAMERMGYESTILYLSATRSAGYAGIKTDIESDFEQSMFGNTSHLDFRGDELRLDGRWYKLSGSHSFSLQDAGSLASLRSDSLESVKALLKSYEVSPSKIEKLTAALRDYTDRDFMPELNGAERADYEARNEPTNRYLSHPGQLMNVLGWQEQLTDLPDLLEEVTIYVGDRENYNTVTKHGLTRLGLDMAQEIQQIMDHRQYAVFSDLSEILKITGRIFERDPMQVSFLPSSYLRLIIYEPLENLEYWSGISMTPMSRSAPWVIDYRYKKSMRNEKNASNSATNPPTGFL